MAELLGLTGGIVLLLQYYYLYHHFPNLLLTSYTQNFFRKYIGWIIALSYFLFFIYGASRDLRESSELFLLEFSETPMDVMSAIMIMLVYYALHHGIEVIARIGGLYCCSLNDRGFAFFYRLVQIFFSLRT
ncbi:GerAB/ArcD/ProY family transporter [Bacillus sp. J33]|uniref:GerAB/ArcD/ProY family transporter n=1 Tax=Bacillus sp. J33 TaxID=935836 RepID=UPI0004789412|nr:GerAB/ArcD/ProY family transporter [Bacillus sp. J33]